MTDTNVQNPQAQVLDDIIKDLGIHKLSQDNQSEIVIKMTESLLKSIFLETMDKLGEQGREEYGKMAEGDVTPEQIEAFFRDKIHDYDALVQQVIEEFKTEMIQSKS